MVGIVKNRLVVDLKMSMSDVSAAKCYKLRHFTSESLINSSFFFKHRLERTITLIRIKLFTIKFAVIDANMERAQ